MTKRILTVLAMVSIAAMMMLSSCTAAGVECGLIGKWEFQLNEVTDTWEFTSDDKFTHTRVSTEDGITRTDTSKGTIEDVTGKALILRYAGETNDSQLEYSELNGDTVKIQYRTYKKVQ